MGVLHTGKSKDMVTGISTVEPALRVCQSQIHSHCSHYFPLYPPHVFGDYSGERLSC